MPIYPAAPVLLYVEDEILIRITLQEVLEDAGFLVVAASDGIEAMAFLTAATPVLHGLITDVNLGKGPDGWDVARSARALVSGLPVVYCSALGGRDWPAKGVRNSLMITKPCAPSEAVAAMASLMAAAC